MGGTEWLERYSGQSTDELIAYEGMYRTDSLVLVFEQALDQKSARIGEQDLTPEERVVLAIEALERQVNNGGYDQFFCCSCEYAPIVVDALHRIGCSPVAEVTQRAIDALGVAGPLTVAAIEHAMEADNKEREEALNACDGQYFKLAGDLAEPLFGFIKKNRDRIRLP